MAGYPEYPLPLVLMHPRDIPTTGGGERPFPLALSSLYRSTARIFCGKGRPLAGGREAAGTPCSQRPTSSRPGAPGRAN